MTSGTARKTITLLAAMAAIGLSQQAHSLTQRTQDLGALQSPQSVTFGNTIAGSGVDFQDTYLFSVTPDATFSSITFAIDISGGVFSIDPASFVSELWSGGQRLAVATNTFFNGNVQSLIEDFSITAGSYDLRVLGTTAGSAGGSYVGNMTVVSPVPEPEIYAMLMVGFGMLGYMARRRKRALGAC